MADYRSKPVLDGDIYCSPWCGMRCTKAAFDGATSAAEALARQMGPGWETHVWENGGWHWRVRKAKTTIRPVFGMSGDRVSLGRVVTGYEAWIEPTTIGQFGVQFIERGDTAEDALGFATQAARTAIARIEQALVDQLEDA